MVPSDAYSGSAREPESAWPRYDAGHRTTMIFNEDGSRTAKDPRSAERAAWDGLEWQSGTWWSLQD
jgi:para-nitrobenzyl esterase